MKDTVTIDAHVLEALLRDGHPIERQSAIRLANEALNAQRTDEEIMRDGVAHHVRRQITHSTVLSVKVYPREDRDSSGMLEWILQYSYESGGGITIGMIQRAPGAEVEFHS